VSEAFQAFADQSLTNALSLLAGPNGDRSDAIPVPACVPYRGGRKGNMANNLAVLDGHERNRQRSRYPQGINNRRFGLSASG
jgi:hypothetical protein